jgi:type II secretory pathway pseudopilin PulG
MAQRFITDNRGIATSLIETVVVIAIVAVISSVAMVSAMEKIEDAKMSRANADAETIAVSIHSFMQDNGFAPVFKSGDARGPEDPFFSVLETQGSDPGIAESLHWPTKAEDRERLENQLVNNRPSVSATPPGTPYPRMGEISWSRSRGWNGPYVATLPSSDPWNNKYFVNVQLLSPKGITKAKDTLGLVLGTGQRPAVFVISAGPNRQLETRFDQVSDAFAAGGDDVVFRIQ